MAARARVDASRAARPWLMQAVAAVVHIPYLHLVVEAAAQQQVPVAGEQLDALHALAVPHPLVDASLRDECRMVAIVKLLVRWRLNQLAI